MFICGSLLGCRGPTAGYKPVGYFGPTEPIQNVVNAANANSQQVTTLRGEGSFSAKYMENGKWKSAEGDVTLLYAYPRSISFLGKHPLAGRVFEIGSNDERFWVVQGPRDSDDSLMQWGNYKNIDRIDVREMPVRPDALIEVLGVGPINTNLMEPPVPEMRFNNDADAYMLVWSAPLQSNWAAAKEIWYDRQTKLPVKVLLFDLTGRILVRANLLDHQPVEVQGVARENWPRVATEFRLFFPDNGATLSFDLKQALALKKGAVPNARSFAFPSDLDRIGHVVQLDEQPQGVN